MINTYSKKVKETARNLRKNGLSLGEISTKLGIPKNTISGWVKSIPLTKNQQKRIKDKEIASAAIGRPLAVKVNFQRTEQWKENIRQKVKYFTELPSHDSKIGKIICGILYICEGGKYPNSRCLSFSNSSPKMIIAFLTLLRKYYNINENKLRFSVSYRWDQDITRLQSFWSKLTNIPKSKCLMNKPDKRTKNKPTLRKDYKGICRLLYYDTSLQFELQTIGENIINYGAGGI